MARDGLELPFADTSAFCLCLVLRLVLRLPDNAGDTRMAAGNLTDTATGWGLFFDNGGNGNSINFKTGTEPMRIDKPDTTGWRFLAASQGASGEKLIYAGDRTAPVSAATTGTKQAVKDGVPTMIGNDAFPVAGFGRPFDVAEAIWFGADKSAMEVAAIFQRSTARLSPCGVTLL